MDTRRFLLAEHYDNLGLFKMADSLDRFDTINQKKTDSSVPKKNTNIIQPILETADKILPPSQLIFLVSELKNLSKEATNLYLINLLENLSSLKTITPDYMQKLENVLGQVKFGQNKSIDKEIVKLLEDASNGIKTNIADVQVLKTKMPSFPKAVDIPKSAANWFQKMNLLKTKSPAQYELAEKASIEIAKKIPLWARAARIIPVVFILLNAMVVLPQAINYIGKIANGEIDRILQDAEERAKFIVFLADAISMVTMFIPPAAPFTSALIAISVGYHGGMYAFDKYKELSGEKEKEELEKSFTDNDKVKKEVPNINLLNKYGYDFYKNFKRLIFEYSDQLKTPEARYALRVIVYPEIRKKLIDNKLANNQKFILKLSDIMGIPGLKTGETVYEDLDKNGKFVNRKIAPADFINNPQDPQNRLAWYEFSNALKYIVVWANQAYKDF
jgi:hypothetical protein